MRAGTLSGGMKMNLVVQKFGGTSVKDAQRVFNVAKIVTDTYQKGNNVVVVVSAQGDTTDDLIAKAGEINPNPSKREMDVLLSTGEQISMSLLAMAIERMGFPVKSLAGRFPDRLDPRLVPHPPDQQGADRQRAFQTQHRNRSGFPGDQPV